MLYKNVSKNPQFVTILRPQKLSGLNL